MDTVLKPATNLKAHASVVRLPHQWFIAATSEELGNKPLGRTIQGVPLALFRDAAGRPAALLDRCPHRNIPLSIGKTTPQGLLQCSYHGWEFDGGGQCRTIPGLCSPAEGPARNAPSYACREQDGFVWVYSTVDASPQRDPFRFENVHDPRYTIVRRHMPLPSTMHAAIENALDVPHTGFLHGGLFRTATKKNNITVKIHRHSSSVEAEYLGEPRPSGLVGRILAPGGGTVTHFDRFIMPCVAQVEYRLGNNSHVLINSAFTPVSDFETMMYAVVAVRLPIPGDVLKPILVPIAMRIFQQDAQVLKLQTDAIRRFGGEQFTHTDIDILGPHIWHLLRQAERDLKAEEHTDVIERQMRT